MTKTFALLAPRIFDGDTWHKNAALIVQNGKIQAISQLNNIPSESKIEQLKSGFLAPGFIDLQVNGGGGVLLNNDPMVEGISTICKAHIAFGTTALLPTLITDTPKIRDAALTAGIEAARTGERGFAGLHIEGPHLSKARKGAHDPDLIRPMNDDDIAALVGARQSLPALITTVAPESVTPQQVRTLTEANIKVSIGHTDATSAQVLALVAAGASMITHLFNAMSQLAGREPGMVGTALNEGALHVGLIADGHHVHPVSMGLALRAKQGPGKVFLVSDAMSPVGTDATNIVLNGRTITRAGGKLTLEDGTLAGADLDLATAVRVMHQQVGIELGEALRMASIYPAQAIGLKNTGSLKSGNTANFVWLSDKLSANKTWIEGVAAT